METMGKPYKDLDEAMKHICDVMRKRIDEAYKRGINDGSLDVKQRAEGAYQKGLEDAWEAARKIAQQWEEDTNTEHRLVIDDSIRITLDSMTASEAIDKLKVYEEKQKAKDEIKVGDEVRHERGWSAVVTSIDNVGFSVMDYNGEVASYSDISKFTKTGRHFDIPKILKEMRT